MMCVEKAFTRFLFIHSGADPSAGQLTMGCTGPHGQGGGDLTPPRGGEPVPPSWPHRLGSSETTLTISQPCLGVLELSLISMAAAFVIKNLLPTQKRECRYPPYTKETPLRVWGIPGQPVLPGLSASTQPALPWHVDTPYHRLLSHTSTGACLSKNAPETPIHTQGKGLRVAQVGWEGTWPGLELPFTFSVPSEKRARGLSGRVVLRQHQLRSHTLCR